jgi:hypothetical protein
MDSTPCSLGMIEAFINDPTHAPDSNCIAAMSEPVFVTP